MNNTQEDNKILFKKVLNDFFNKRIIDVVDEYYSDNYIQHNETVANMAKSQGLKPVEGMKTFFKIFFEAFPDYSVSIEHLFAEKDMVFATCNWQGTHKNSFMGIEPTGKTIKVRTAEIMRIENGKFVEHWDVVDETNMLITLGSLTDNRKFK